MATNTAKKRKLLIDCQILQTVASSRGMGKYSFSLLEALLRISDFSKRYEPIFIFNANLSKDKANRAMTMLKVKATQSLWVDLPSDISTDWDAKYREAEKKITATLDDYLLNNESADFMVLSPFFVGYPTVFPQLARVKKFGIVYDLIPYLIWQKQKIFPDEIYFKHYKLFIEADHLFSISNAVKEELINILGIPASEITNINGAPFEAKEKQGAGKNDNIPSQPYILFISAPIVHKNNERAFQAFSEFNKNHGNRYKLVITSWFDEATRTRLSKIADHTLFVGNVQDSMLIRLYKGCEAVFFASMLEGLGMPVLEGVMHNKPVVCSDIKVLTEISKEAFYLFDPLSSQGMVRALEEAVSGNGWGPKKALYPSITHKYRWNNSAKKVLSILCKPIGSTVTNKPTIRVICPNPSRNNAAGRLLESLYAQLAINYSIDLHLLESRGHPMPTYVQYVNEGPLAEPTKAIMISNGRSISNPSIPTLFISLRRGWLSYFSRKKSHEIIVKAISSPVDTKLGLQWWEYFVGDKKLKNSTIIDALKKVGELR